MNQVIDTDKIDAIRSLNIMLDLVINDKLRIVEQKEKFKQMSSTITKGTITFKYVREHEPS